MFTDPYEEADEQVSYFISIIIFFYKLVVVFECGPYQLFALSSCSAGDFNRYLVPKVMVKCSNIVSFTITVIPIPPSGVGLWINKAS